MSDSCRLVHLNGLPRGPVGPMCLKAVWREPSPRNGYTIGHKRSEYLKGLAQTGVTGERVNPSVFKVTSKYLHFAQNNMGHRAPNGWPCGAHAPWGPCGTRSPPGESCAARAEESLRNFYESERPCAAQPKPRWWAGGHFLKLKSILKTIFSYYLLFHTF